MSAKEIIEALIKKGFSIDLIATKFGRVSSRTIRRWYNGLEPQRKQDLEALRNMYNSIICE